MHAASSLPAHYPLHGLLVCVPVELQCLNGVSLRIRFSQSLSDRNSAFSLLISAYGVLNIQACATLHGDADADVDSESRFQSSRSCVLGVYISQVLNIRSAIVCVRSPSIVMVMYILASIWIPKLGTRKVKICWQHTKTSVYSLFINDVHG